MERIKEQEMREREGQQMLRNIELLKQEEIKAAEAKRVLAQQQVLEVEEVNKKAIDIKEGRK